MIPTLTGDPARRLREAPADPLVEAAVPAIREIVRHGMLLP